jgi:hypothetical protein
MTDAPDPEVRAADGWVESVGLFRRRTPDMSIFISDSGPRLASLESLSELCTRVAEPVCHAWIVLDAEI